SRNRILYVFDTDLDPGFKKKAFLYQLGDEGTLLHMMVAQEKRKVLSSESFLRIAGVALNARNAKGKTPLMVTIQTHYDKSLPWVETLLESKADPTIADFHKRTPLIAAI